ncbi:MAG: indole-3-glycerol phosphate synthase TrpC, partial [Coriobacteriaceae bacterium]|nr:indole-3-glycerol phosphate synthase TrpC [Coriobacteriaceae bacterium]
PPRYVNRHGYLQAIIESTQKRVDAAKQERSLDDLRWRAEEQAAGGQAGNAKRRTEELAADGQAGATNGQAGPASRQAEEQAANKQAGATNRQVGPTNRQVTNGQAVKDESRPFLDAISKPGLSFICEVKQASPSKGQIVANFDHLSIARDYEEAGADALSVLTEPVYFRGDSRYLAEIAKQVKIPVLRKDFVLDEYQIYESRVLGASAILLIVAILDDGQLGAFLELSERLGMEALVETHNKEELQRALTVGARIVGVNNRDLKTFKVDIGVSERLRPLVPSDVVYVAESGIGTASDLQRMVRAKADAVLVGEALMQASERRDKLLEFREIAGGTEVHTVEGAGKATSTAAGKAAGKAAVTAAVTGAGRGEGR